MKNLLLISTLFTIIGFSSCKKDFNCVCRYDVLGVEQVDVHKIEDVKRDTAEDECAEHEEEMDILYDATCELE